MSMRAYIAFVSLFVITVLAGCGDGGDSNVPLSQDSTTGLAIRLWPTPVSPDNTEVTIDDPQLVPVSTQFDIVAIKKGTSEVVKTTITDVRFSRSDDGGNTWTDISIFSWADQNTGSGSFYREDQSYPDQLTIFRVNAKIVVGDIPTDVERKFTVR